MLLGAFCSKSSGLGLRFLVGLIGKPQSRVGTAIIATADFLVRVQESHNFAEGPALLFQSASSKDIADVLCGKNALHLFCRLCPPISHVTSREIFFFLLALGSAKQIF